MCVHVCRDVCVCMCVEMYACAWLCKHVLLYKLPARLSHSMRFLWSKVYIYVSTFQFLSYYTWDCARYWYYKYNLPLLINYVSLIGLSFLWVSYIWLLSWCLTCTLINMASDLSFREPGTFLSQSYTFLCSMLFFSSQLPLVKNPPHLARQLVSSVSS